MTRLTGSELLKSPVEFKGALGFDETEQGVMPSRLPSDVWYQIPAPMDLMVRMPSGVRLAFRTDSPEIVLNVHTLRRTYVGRPEPEVRFELIVDGGESRIESDPNGNRLAVDMKTREFEIEEGAASDIRFDELGDGMKDVELWLPANAHVEIRRFELADGAKLEAPSRSSRLRWMHYGSSISHGAGASRPTATWPAVAAALGNVELWNLGFGGHCHLDQFVARAIRDARPDFITIKIGINVVNLDSMRERVFTPALHGFLDTLRETLPETPILLISPIWFPGGETDPGPHFPGPNGKWIAYQGHEEVQFGCLNLVRIRRIVEKAVRVRQERGDKHLGYLNGLELFDEADEGDLPDGLHPDTRGLRKMGERFAEKVFSEGGILSALR